MSRSIRRQEPADQHVYLKDDYKNSKKALRKVTNSGETSAKK